MRLSNKSSCLADRPFFTALFFVGLLFAGVAGNQTRLKRDCTSAAIRIGSPQKAGDAADDEADDRNRSESVFTVTDYGCASELPRQRETETETATSGSDLTTTSDAGAPHYVDLLNNCTSDFPPNSSTILINGVPLLFFSLCNAAGELTNQSSKQTAPINASAIHQTTLAFPLWTTIVVALLSLVISVVTVVGNVIVLISFFIERSLRQATNYFIASLAVSDLLIGLFSMNFYTLYIILNDEWVLGKVVCNLWLSLDYTVCLASQYTVFFITVDRFCSVKMPAKYRNWRTDNKVLAMVLVSWIIPSLVFFVSIMGWDFFTDAPPANPNVKISCIAGFQNDPLFNFLLTVFYYWTTLFLMCGLYVGIYRVALNMARKAEAKQRRLNSQLSGSSQQTAPAAPKRPSIANNAPSVNNNRPEDEGRPSSLRAQTMRGPSAVAGKRHSNSHILPRLGGEVGECSSYFDRTEDSGGDDQRHHESLQSAILCTTVALLHSAQLADRQPLALRKLSNSNGNQPKKAARCKCAKVQVGSGYYQSVEADTDFRNERGSLSFSVGTSHNTYVLRRYTVASGAQQGDNALVPAELCSQNHNRTGRSHRELPPLLPQLRTANIVVSADENDEDQEQSPIWRRRPSFEEKNRGRGGHDRLAKPLLRPKDDKAVVGISLSRCMQPNDRFQMGWNGPTNYAVNESASAAPAIGMKLLHDRVDESTNRKANVGRDEHNLIVPMATTANHSDIRRSASQEDAATRILDICAPQRNSLAVPEHPPISAKSSTASFSGKVRTYGRKLAQNCTRICSREKTEQKSKSENRAKKAVRTITFILGAFVTCWTPYHIMVIVSSFWPETVNSEIFNHFFRMFYWLCYLNSPINPFCYAFVNAQFKKTFIRILKFDLRVK